MPSLLKTLAENMRRCRKAKGYSQESLAEKAGLHRTYVGAIERGERNITILSLEKIAKALGVQVGELLSSGRN